MKASISQRQRSISGKNTRVSVVRSLAFRLGSARAILQVDLRFATNRVRLLNIVNAATPRPALEESGGR